MDKKQLDIKSDTYFSLFCFIISVILLATTIYRAAVMGITIDEALTSIFYTKDGLFYMFTNLEEQGMIANNHILNSFFITLFHTIFNVRYNEFLTRLPNILCYIPYLIFSYKITKDKKYRYSAFSLFAINYGVNEFFGLGRGYGMACSFVLIAVYMFTKYLKNNSYKNLTLSFLFMIIACYCNTVALIPYATILIITFIKLVKDKEIFKYIFKHIIFIVPLIVLSILAVIYHFYLSDSNFLYGGHTGFFQDTLHSIPIMIGFNPKYSSIIVNVFLLLYIFIFGYNFKKIKNNYMAYSAIIMFALLIITTFVSKRPWVTGRCLIPMYPIIFISIIEIIETIKFKQIWKSKLLQVFLILPLLFIFINKYDLYDVREWSDETKYRTIAYKALETKDNSKAMEYSSAPSLEFYREKILYYNKYDIFKR